MLCSVSSDWLSKSTNSTTSGIIRFAVQRTKPPTSRRGHLPTGGTQGGNMRYRNPRASARAKALAEHKKLFELVLVAIIMTAILILAANARAQVEVDITKDDNYKAMKSDNNADDLATHKKQCFQTCSNIPTETPVLKQKFMACRSMCDSAFNARKKQLGQKPPVVTPPVPPTNVAPPTKATPPAKATPSTKGKPSAKPDQKAPPAPPALPEPPASQPEPQTCPPPPPPHVCPPHYDHACHNFWAMVRCWWGLFVLLLLLIAGGTAAGYFFGLRNRRP